MKRFLDVMLSLLAIIVLSPFFLVISLVIRASSKGPAFFRQSRAGLNGRPFTFHKFRTMKMDVDPFGPSPKAADDSRLTRVGKFLREHSLDELP